LSIVAIKSYHGGEFESKNIRVFCENYVVNHNFSIPRTTYKNGVVERKILFFYKK